MEAAVGRPRAAWATILLTFLTFGVYWFVWLYRTFKEVADARRVNLRLVGWTTTLVCIFILVVLATLLQFLEPLRAVMRTGDLQSLASTDDLVPHGAVDWLAILLNAALVIASYPVLRAGTIMVRDATVDLPGVLRPNEAQVRWFSILGIAGMVPIIGAVFWVTAFVVWAIWNSRIQGAINAFWAHLASTGMAETNPLPTG